MNEKLYQATTRGGSGLVSVYASTEDEARTLVRKALSRPGRWDVLNTWKEHGELVRAKE